MTKTIHVHVGTPEDMGRRFVDAWTRAARGETVDEANVTFRDLETLLTTLTPGRLHLLRHVRHHQVRSIRALAGDLRRDYKNVHRDVEALVKVGMLSRTDDGIVAPYAEVEARIVL